MLMPLVCKPHLGRPGWKTSLRAQGEEEGEGSLGPWERCPPKLPRLPVCRAYRSEMKLCAGVMQGLERLCGSQDSTTSWSWSHGFLLLLTLHPPPSPSPFPAQDSHLGPVRSPPSEGPRDGFQEAEGRDRPEFCSPPRLCLRFPLPVNEIPAGCFLLPSAL